MLKLLKYLRRYTAAVAAIFLLLALQAFCDLSLPQYTSDIVDVGIQQGGIEYAVPERIRQSTLDALLPFMTQAQQELVLASYRAEDDGVMLLTAQESDTLEQLDEAFGIPMLCVSYLQENPDAQSALEQSGMSGSMAPEAVQAIRSQLEQSLGGNTDTLVRQKALEFVKSEYQALGMDLNRIQHGYLIRTGGKMLGVTLLMAAAAVTVNFMSSRLGAKVGMELRTKVFSRVVSFSNAETDRFSTASLITRSTNDVQQVQMVLVLGLRMVLYAPILGIGGVVRVLGTHTGMTWIIALGVGLVMVLIAVLMGTAMPKFKRMQLLIDKVNLVSREILTGLPVIRAFSREQHETRRFDAANSKLMRTQLFTNRVMTFMQPSMMLLMNGISVLIVWVGAQHIDAGNMQVGDMIAFITYTMQIVMSFLMISMLSIILPRAGVAAKRISEVIETESSILDPEAPADARLDNPEGVICFDDVSFRYPDSDADALEHISFTARPGETTAIIGSTGSGKSTLLNLIPRFFDVTSGRITFDGIDIRSLSQHKLRSLLGYVPQKGILFSGDIESNLKFGGDDITDEQMRRAADIAQATEFIEQKPDRYHTPIAQGGSNVSGGQKQRLSIARAIAKQPKVYLFDDSFSALDYKTDSALRRALANNVRDAAVIIVAQRISTIAHAQQIIVLDEGRVVGKGTHEELMRSCSEYQEIAKSQLSESELGGMPA